MKWWVTAMLFFGSGMVFAEEKQACLYDFQCSEHESCEAGVCAPKPFRQVANSEAECGADRRCRIDRMKRANAARRYVKVVEEEEAATRAVEDAQKAQDGVNPRVEKPVTVDWRASRLGPLGLAGGYTFLKQFKVEGQAFFFDDEYYSDSAYDSFDVTSLVLSGLYFTNPEQISGYLGVGFHYGFGEIGNYDFFRGNSEELVFHALELQAGLDVQAEVGFHVRLGASYRPLIYHRVASAPGVYNPVRKDQAEAWYRDNMMIDIVFLIGWAF